MINRLKILCTVRGGEFLTVTQGVVMRVFEELNFFKNIKICKKNFTNEERHYIIRI